jgi:formate hydrogenlyase subunit 3/multisubunit Na+/H+ antiporter MnhD subunit
MNLLTFIYIPLLAGFIALLLPRKLRYFQETVAIIGSLFFFKEAIQSFFINDQFLRIHWFQLASIDFSFDFRLYHFSRFLLVFLGLFTLLTALYSAGYFRERRISQLYFPFVMFTLAGSATAVLADNFFVLLIAWEIVTMLLFFLIAMGQGKPAAMAAGKAFAILGFTDVALLLAVLVLPLLYNTWNITALRIQLGDPFSIIIFLLMFVAAIAKAGAIPLHSWIPSAAESAPLPVIAFLPASLDKLLGIYLLARITLDVFVLPAHSALSYVIMIIGAVTIIVGVFVAVVQHDLKRLLSYHAISQVGYMVLGIGTGNPIGIAGGLFHMLNHAIYKSCLFFTAGSVETRTKTTDVDKLGGLSKSMPFTFAACLIAALSISGVPPFNGFVSKWMIYQGLVEGRSMIFMVFLFIAMFGSALTLASFLKLLYGTFLGQRYEEKELISGSNAIRKYNDVSWTMIIPMSILALLCIGFGLFAFFPINNFIQPVLTGSLAKVGQTITLGTALWNPTLATILLLLGLLVGGIIFTISRIKVREVETLFIGGEQFDLKNERMLAGNFYEFLEKIKVLGGFIRESNKGIFDIYNISGSLGLVAVNVLRKLHDGILSTYLAWCVIGLGILCFILVVLQ